MILDQIEVLVLIETLWNVKYQFDHVVNRTSCINRNIVECKAGHGEQTKRNELSINRNIVECKVYKMVRTGDPRPVLIETLWNVKGIKVDTKLKLV